MDNNYNLLKTKVEQLDRITTRPMFGYQCFSVSGKFFVGFSNKSKYQVIVRLPKDQQEYAIKTKTIKPFSHGSKMGWIEINTKLTSSTSAFNWIRKGYDFASQLSKK